MTKKILFTILFIFSLSGVQIASFTDWLILSLIIQIIWITVTSNEILRLAKYKNRIDKIFQIFNKVLIYMLVADIVIIILSLSFGFRIIFAPLYKPTFYISGVCMVVSVFGNYYIIINDLIKKTDSLDKRITLILSSLFYPIGVYTINTDNK